jgi:hypothetical protein
MSEIKRAVQLAELLLKARDAVADLESQLTVAKADVARLEQEDLPDLMLELGLTSFKMDNGASVEVVPDVQCGITEERRRAAHDWLIENNFGGLIKTEVSVAFGKGELEQAQALAEQVHGSVKESVHSATLKSFVKEQMAAGAAVPFDLFGVRPFNRAKITLKK